MVGLVCYVVSVLGVPVSVLGVLRSECSWCVSPRDVRDKVRRDSWHLMLHASGGLYAGLETKPNRSWYVRTSSVSWHCLGSETITLQAITIALCTKRSPP